MAIAGRPGRTSRPIRVFISIRAIGLRAQDALAQGRASRARLCLQVVGAFLAPDAPVRAVSLPASFFNRFTLAQAMWGALLVVLQAALLSGAAAIDNGIGLTPPLGWRSVRPLHCCPSNAISSFGSCIPVACEYDPPSSQYNAFGGRVSQAMMTEMMDAMVDRSRTVGGKPTSLLDLGYQHIGLDGGWNHCFPDNHTFHWVTPALSLIHI